MGSLSPRIKVKKVLLLNIDKPEEDPDNAVM
jgi:hypothetical protein